MELARDDAKHGVHILLLGPFELRVDGYTVEVPRTRVRDLLTLLAVRAPEIVSFESLIDDLWAEDPPQNPRAALRVVLSRARKALGERSEALATTPAGLRLHATTDMQEFLQPSLEATNPDVFVDALSLWRGVPHVSVLPTVSLYAHAQSLLERRNQLLLRLAELSSLEGRPGGAVALLEPEAIENPGSEQMATRLAAAYAASGRKAEALRTLETTRQTLRSELGVDPGPEFAELERNILQDAVDVHVAPIPSAGDHQSRFVGRLAELNQALDPSGGRIAIVGEAGIGKTRLLDEVSRKIEADGGIVIRSTCSEAPERAMQVLADILEQVLRRTENQELPAETVRALRRVDPALAPDQRTAVVAPIRRTGLLKILADFLTAQLSKLGAVLILDDAQWLDHGSADVLQQLLAARGPRTILAARPTPSGDHTFINEVPMEIIQLEGLSEAHSKTIITDSLGANADPQLVERIHDQSAGNPFFLEILTALASEGALGQETLPVSALIAVQSRIDRLSRASRQTLLAASVLGQTVDLNVLVAIRPSAQRDILEAIDEGLLHHTAGASTANFVHAVVAQGAYELLSDGRRADLHDQAAVALDHLAGSPIEFARHAALAEVHDPYRSAEGHVRAGRAYLQTLSHTAAINQAHAARLVVSRWDLRDPELLGQLCLLEGEAVRWSDGDASAKALLQAVHLAREHGDTELEIDAALALCRRGQNTFAGAIHEGAASAVDHALARTEVSDMQRARLLAGSSLLFAASTSDSELRSRFSEAISLSQTLGSDQLEAEVLLESDFGLCHPEDFAKRASAAQRLRELAGTDEDLLWEAAWLDFGLAVQLGDGQAAAAAATQMRDGVDRVSQRPRDFGMSMVESVIAQTAGHHGRANQWADNALTIGLRQFPESWATNAYGALLLGIRRDEGRVGELFDVFEPLQASNPQFTTWEVCLTYAALEAGDLERCTIHFDRLASKGFDRLVSDGSWTATVGVLVEIASRLERDEETSTLYDMLTPFSGRMLWSSVSPYGPADASLAVAANALGRPGAAAQHRDAATLLTDRLSPLGELSRCPPTPD